MSRQKLFDTPCFVSRDALHMDLMNYRVSELALLGGGSVCVQVKARLGAQFLSSYVTTV